MSWGSLNDYREIKKRKQKPSTPRFGNETWKDLTLADYQWKREKVNCTANENFAEKQ